MNRDYERLRIGTELAERRKQMGKTQADIADATGVQRNHISRIEAGRYHFEDDGIYIAISTFYSHIFQHKAKIYHFALNKETKQWRHYQTVIVEKHTPDKQEPVENNEIKSLKR